MLNCIGAGNLPGQDGLILVSEREWRRVQDVREVLNVGDLVKFKVIGRDPKNGKLKLSRKALLPRPEGTPEEQN